MCGSFPTSPNKTRYPYRWGINERTLYPLGKPINFLFPFISTASVLNDMSRLRVQPLDAVEDQIESELELVGVVVAGLPHMLDHRLGEVGVVTGGELSEHPL